MPRLAAVAALLLALAAPVLPAAAHAPTPGASRAVADAPLDLAAMVLTPPDLAAAGLPGFGVGSGRTQSVDALADRAVWPAGKGEAFAAARAALVAAGWRQAYEASLATDLDGPGPVRYVEVGVVAYADAAGATAGLALIPDAYATGTMAAVAGTATIGDASRITRIAAHDPGAGTPYAELVLGFRHGRLTGRVLLRNPVEEPPAIAAIEALAAALVTRIERILAGGGPGPSLYTHALRVEPRTDMTFGTDAYLRLDGEDRRFASEAPEALAERAAAYGDATDIFASATEIPANDSTYNLGLHTALARFATDDRASAWLHGAPDRLGQAADVTAFAAEAGIAGLGDEALAVTMARDPGGDGSEVARAAIVVVRVAAVVAEVRLERTNDAPPPAAARDLARAQVACLGAEDCLRLLPAPLSLTGGLDGDAYTSPTFGYALSWNPEDWDAITAAVREGHDRLVPSHYGPEGTSEVTFDAYAGHGGDPTACLASATDAVFAEATAIRPAEDAAGQPIAGEADGFVFAAFTYEAIVGYAGGRAVTGVYAGWFACRTLVAGEAVLAVRLVTRDLDAFREHLTLLSDVLGRLDLPGGTGVLSGSASRA